MNVDQFKIFLRPTAVATALYVVSVGACLIAVGRPFLYALDDAYIHLALARTLAETGVWGVQPGDPAAASSSPLWTLMLAALASLPRVPAAFLAWWPLLLNLAFGAGLIVQWNAILAGRAAWYRGVWASLALVAGSILAGLTALTLIGMEHIAHMLICTALVWAAARAISAETAPADDKVPGPAAVGALAALAVAARYESLFAVAPLMAFAAARGRPRLVAALAVGAAAPVLGFGFYWTLHGGWMLPNSLLVKAVAPARASGLGGLVVGIVQDLSTNLGHRISTISLAAISLFAATLAGLEWRRRRNPFDPRIILAVTTLCAAAIQMVLASLGWLYRYEAWLIALGLISVALLVPPLTTPEDATARRRSRWLVAAAVLVLAAVGLRAIRQASDTILAIDDRRNEHLSVADFLRANYAGKLVVMNDVGLAAYQGGPRLLDIFGLADNAPVRLRRAGAYGPAQVADLVANRRASIAVMQVCWFEVWTRAPANWPLVEVWRIPRNTAFGDRDIGFFATSPAEVGPLKAALSRTPPPAKVQVLHPSALEWTTFLEAARAGGPIPPTSEICRTSPVRR